MMWLCKWEQWFLPEGEGGRKVPNRSSQLPPTPPARALWNSTHIRPPTALRPTKAQPTAVGPFFFWQVEVAADNDDQYRLWEGWVHSRLRHLVTRLQPLVCVRPWPKPVGPPEEADGTQEAGGPVKRCYYYIGLKKKQQPAGVRGGLPANGSVNLNVPVQEFRSLVRDACVCVGGRVW